MAIDLNSLSGSLSGNRVRTAGQASGKDEVSKKETPAPQVATKADSVKLSDEALRLNSRAKSAPDIDEGKVSAIKAALADGTYKIDYQALAKSIIQFENEL